MGLGILRILSVLVATGLVLYGSYLFTRLAARKLQPGFDGRKSRIRVLDRAVLGQDKFLAVVKIGARVFLIGVASSQVSLLSELSKEEAELWEEQPEDGASGENTGFSRLLRQTYEKCKGKKEEE